MKTCVVLSVKFNHMNHDMIHAKVQKTRDGSKSGSMEELEQKRKEKDWMAEGKSGLIFLDKIPTLTENWSAGLLAYPGVCIADKNAQRPALLTT